MCIVSLFTTVLVSSVVVSHLFCRRSGYAAARAFEIASILGLIWFVLYIDPFSIYYLFPGTIKAFLVFMSLLFAQAGFILCVEHMREARQRRKWASVDVDWAKLVACYGRASAIVVPRAVSYLFSSFRVVRTEARDEIDNVVVVQGTLFESAPYAARLIVDRIKYDPRTISSEALEVLFELARGCSGECIQYGPMKGRRIEDTCHAIVAECADVLLRQHNTAGDHDRAMIRDIIEVLREAGFCGNFDVTKLFPGGAAQASL